MHTLVTLLRLCVSCTGITSRCFVNASALTQIMAHGYLRNPTARADSNGRFGGLKERAGYCCLHLHKPPHKTIPAATTAPHTCTTPEAYEDQ
jgi:hypothetical protein